MSRVSISPSGTGVTIVPQPPRPVTIQRSGVQGRKGDTGETGNDGWSPVLAAVSDGSRRVHQIAGWVGGQGNEPDTGGYLGPDGVVTDIAEGTDVRGPAGAGADTPAIAAIGELTPAPSTAPYFTGAATASLMTVTPAARGLLDDASASAMLTTLGASSLGQSLLAAADAESAQILLNLSRVRSQLTTIADDTALQIALGAGVIGWGVVAPQFSSGAAALFAFRATSGGYYVRLLASVGTIDVRSIPLTGTTGADGGVTIAATSGNLWLENRTGGAQPYLISLFRNT
ncbi:hypothetical protein [Xanthobacter sediminis]